MIDFQESFYLYVKINSYKFINTLNSYGPKSKMLISVEKAINILNEGINVIFLDENDYIKVFYFLKQYCHDFPENKKALNVFEVYIDILKRKFNIKKEIKTDNSKKKMPFMKTPVIDRERINQKYKKKEDFLISKRKINKDKEEENEFTMHNEFYKRLENIPNIDSFLLGNIDDSDEFDDLDFDSDEY